MCGIVNGGCNIAENQIAKKKKKEREKKIDVWCN